MSMVTYPLNNIEYTAEDAELFHSTRTSGVYATDSFDFSVTGADNTVVIGTGIAWIKNGEFSGKVVAQKEPVSLDLGLPDSIYPRIDAIIIKFDSNNNASEIVVKEGTASSNPIAPNVVRTESVYELHLYHVRRNAGALTISANDITDIRSNNNYCGLMIDSVTQAVDTTLSKNGVAADASAVGIALDGKAPSGCGLGKVSGELVRFTTPQEVNSCFKAGWYEYESSEYLNGAGTQYGGILVIPSMWNYTQFFFCRQYYGCYMKRTYKGDSVWDAWEWVNPPMIAGVEYLTTERWQGKPVYVKLLSLGNLPNATEKSVKHNIANLDYPLSITAGAKSSSWSFALPLIESALTKFTFNHADIAIRCTGDWSGYTAFATLKYTKS